MFILAYVISKSLKKNNKPPSFKNKGYMHKMEDYEVMKKFCGCSNTTLCCYIMRTGEDDVHAVYVHYNLKR